MFTARKMAKVFFTNSGSEANDTQVCRSFKIFRNHKDNIYNKALKSCLDNCVL